MALTLTKAGIVDGQTIETHHVTQSIDAFNGSVAYNIKISGSLVLTGSVSSKNGFTGSLMGTSSWSSLATTSSYSVTSSLAQTAQTASYVANAVSASVVTSYTWGTSENVTVYPQGTMYAHFSNVYAFPPSDIDILSGSLGTYEGIRTLGVDFYNQVTDSKARILRFRATGKFDVNTGQDLVCYVKLGNQILNSTNLGTVTLNQNQGHPFEIVYDIVFQNTEIRTCGAIGYCDNTGDYRKVALSNLYVADTAVVGMVGDIQMVISGSSTTVMTGSLVNIEFLN